eukprot:TRINITY_DN4587_c0_g1_i2.p1 TRINITY_DN4587_c0_g1~~TRINITY_DN4587_c0_g1_i2.p1  ORF type:complete len:286 (-),score=-16.57 TRINITY_DN4587_c0_g1_i2:628-1485(-)
MFLCAGIDFERRHPVKHYLNYKQQKYQRKIVDNCVQPPLCFVMCIRQFINKFLVYRQLYLVLLKLQKEPNIPTVCVIVLLIMDKLAWHSCRKQYKQYVNMPVALQQQFYPLTEEQSRYYYRYYFLRVLFQLFFLENFGRKVAKFFQSGDGIFESHFAMVIFQIGNCFLSLVNLILWPLFKCSFLIHVFRRMFWQQLFLGKRCTLLYKLPYCMPLAPRYIHVHFISQLVFYTGQTYLLQLADKIYGSKYVIYIYYYLRNNILHQIQFIYLIHLNISVVIFYFCQRL